MTGKNKNTLPNHIKPFKNPDKEFQEEATSDLLFMPHSSRVYYMVDSHQARQQRFSTWFCTRNMIE